MNFSVFTKPICRFLIHRYMGQYLKTQLTSDQLEFRLADGTASVQSVFLNTEYINEILDPLGIVSLVEGFVKEISVCVPWKKLMTESTIIRVEGLELTFTPLTDISMANTQDLVSSVIGSIASSMDLARSVIADETIVEGADNAGVEQFANLIDQVISRIKLTFENVIVRIEAYSELCTGLEIQIDFMEFLDEQLEVRLQQQKSVGDAITEQPSSLYTVTDLNKLLHIQGIRFYTDIWSPLKDRLSASRMQSSDVDLDSGNSASGELSNSTINFQSCYSHFSSRSNSNSARPPNSIPPNPIMFAQSASERHTIRIRMNNASLPSSSDNTVYNKRVEIELFFGGPLHFFSTPSQIVLLKDLLTRLIPKYRDPVATNPATYGGRPMRLEHFQKITEQIHGDFSGARSDGRNAPRTGGISSAFGGGCLTGAWSGNEQFYDLSLGQNEWGETDMGAGKVLSGRPPSSISGSVADSFSVRNRSDSLDSDAVMGRGGKQRSNASTTTLVERRPDMFTLTVRAPQLLAVVTHEDPLGMAETKERGDQNGDFVTVRNTVCEMAERANAFFKRAESLRIARKRLDEQREVLAELYNNDSLRMVATGAILALTLVNDSGARSSLNFEGQLEDCDFVECLQNEAENNLSHFDVFNLSDREKDISFRNAFTFRIHNSIDRSNEYSVELNLEKCRTELDPSLVDRLSNLLFTRPAFAPYTRSSAVQSPPGNDGGVVGLRDNFLISDMAMDTAPPPNFHLKLFCSEWTVDLRIPIADLSEVAPNYRIRSVHPEYLHLVMGAAFLEFPRFQPSDLSTFGTLNIQCKSITGSFLGDPKVLDCSADELLFLHSDSQPGQMLDNGHAIKLKISYDTRNKALRTNLLYNLDETLLDGRPPAKSMYESYFRPREEDKIEGPFAKTSSYFADTKLIMAGSREELLEFADECQQGTSFSVDLSMPRLNLALPSHKFFEVLYNRLANDLALWEPRSPLIKSAKLSADLNAQLPLQQQQFTECKSCDNHSDFLDGFSDRKPGDRNSSSSSGSAKKTNNRGSHLFSLGLHVGRARVLLQTDVKRKEQQVPFLSQIGAEFAKGELFVTYGFNEDPNLTYLFVTATKADLYHRNLIDGISCFGKNVMDMHGFAAKSANDVHVEDVPADQPCTRVADDNLAVSLKIQLHPEENMKDILLAVALRNSLVHLRPVVDKALFWAGQFTNFFNVLDYGVPGYVLPLVKVDLHVHLNSVLVGYDHSTLVPHSPLQLRLEVGSCDLNARLMQEMERFKFQCLLEDTKLWMRKKKPYSVKFESFGRYGTGQSLPAAPFVKVVLVGLLHFTVAYTVANLEQMAGPALELTCINDLIKVWVCSDTVVELANLVNEVLRSETIKQLLSGGVETKESDTSSAEKLAALVKQSNMYSSVCSEMSRSTVTARSVTLAQPTPKKELSADEADRLMKMMASAMQETPTFSPSALKRKRQERAQRMGNFIREEDREEFDFDAQNISVNNPFAVGSPSTIDDDYGSTSADNTTENTDDEFILIEKVPTSGLGISGPSRNARLDPDFEIISRQIRVPNSSDEGHFLADLPSGHPPPLLRYTVKDVSLCVFFFAGSDFGDSRNASKTYSQWDTRRDSAECVQCESQGGRFRDRTVCVELRVSKLSFVCEVFNATAPVLSLAILKIADVEVYDRLLVSNIHKIFYQSTNAELPRRVQTPIFSVHMMEDQLREGKLRISLMPIRLNFDQDTLEFLQDFLADVSQGIRPFEMGRTDSTVDDTPVMEVPKAAPQLSQLYPELTRNETATVGDSRRSSASVGISFSALKESEERLEQPVTNLEDLFSEEDVHLSDSLCAKLNFGSLENLQNFTSTEDHNSPVVDDNPPSTLIARDLLPFDPSPDFGTTSQQQQIPPPSRETFFKEFTFSPACRIRLDYVGKRIKMDQGALVGLIAGTTNLNKMELVLKELRCEKGIVSLNRCVNYATNEWTQDIGKQYPNVLGSYAPISALVQLAQGFRDLFAIPMEEFRKEDGRVVRGLQMGASNFGLRTATAALDATQHLASIIQNVAEFAFDIVTPDYAYQRQRRLLATNQRAQVAGDIREGLTMAYDTVREGVMDTAQTLQAAAEEDGQWGMGILRHMTPSAIKPIVIASKATVQVLGGLKNQLHPDDHREELEKWRHSGSNRAISTAQLRRLPSSGSLQSSSSSSLSMINQQKSSSGL